MAEVKLETTVNGLFFGAAKQRWPDKPPSAIDKQRIEGTHTISIAGFTDDAQADLTVHGGVDKAIHHYPADHYPAWQSEGQMEEGIEPALFGENISSLGLTEDNVCIGDVFSFGSSTIQVSQGRQPCWKLNAHTGNDRMAFLFQKSGRTGWYYRILKTGEAGAGDRLKLLDRPCEGWSVKRVTKGRLTRKISKEDAAILAEMPELAMGWREAFAKFAAGNRKENTAGRLGK
ncbi:MOSC domain-containing protein [Parasphingorhabdus sp.]|uniref:MOSC domain-containing protein n=1 Tax=Parasphingorhabdus sp. TaxID=2709688 RepID=UPI003D2BDDFD